MVNYIPCIWKSERFILVAATEINPLAQHLDIFYVLRATWLEVVGDTKMVKTNLCNPGPSNSNMRQTLFLSQMRQNQRGSTAPECGQDTKAGPFLGDMELL